MVMACPPNLIIMREWGQVDLYVCPLPAKKILLGMTEALMSAIVSLLCLAAGDFLPLFPRIRERASLHCTALFLLDSGHFCARGPLLRRVSPTRRPTIQHHHLLVQPAEGRKCSRAVQNFTQFLFLIPYQRWNQSSFYGDLI